MANDNINEVSKPMQEGHADLLARIGKLEVEFINLKQSVFMQMQHEGIEPREEAPPESGETIPAPGEATYTFTEAEQRGMTIFFDACSKALRIINEVRPDIIPQLGEDRHKQLVTLSDAIAALFRQPSYHFPTVKKFNDWINKRKVQ